jgi:cell division septal protein FtsQ
MVQSKVSRSALRSKQQKKSDYSIGTWIGAWSFFVAALLALFVLLLYQSFFQISHISVQGTHVVHPHDVGIQAQDILSQKKLWLVPFDSWVTMPNKKIKKHLYEQFDRIKHVDLSVKNFDQLVITIDEWDPAFLWCNIDEVESTRSCWFMDEQGNIFSKAPYFSPGVYPMFVTPASSLDAVLGEKKIDPEILEQVLAIYMMLESNNSTIETITFGEEMDIVFTLQKLQGTLLDNTELLVTRAMSVDVMSENLELLLGHTTFREKFDAQPELLEYIDLRFDGKLLFRFK